MAEETASCGSPAKAGEQCWEYTCHQVKDTLNIPRCSPGFGTYPFTEGLGE